MTTEDNHIYENLDVLKTDLNAVKKDLFELNEQKEHWFSEKEKIGTSIRENIKLVKEGEKRASGKGDRREFKEA